MPGRKYTNGSEYRYGFNGKELDTDEGLVQYDYGFRIYDPRLARFKSVDPLSGSYPYYTPYQFAGNMPIAAIDLDGLEQYVVIYYKDQQGNTTEIQIRAIFDNKGDVLNQHVHKVGQTKDIAKGNVLVFESYEQKNGYENMKLIDERNTRKSQLTAEELTVFKLKKQEQEKGKTQSLAYGGNPTGGPHQYQSQNFENADTKTFSAIYGIVPPDKKDPPDPTFSLNNFHWDKKGNMDNQHNTDMYKRIAGWLKSNPDHKLDVGVSGIDDAAKKKGKVLITWNDVLEDNLFSKDITYGDRTDNVIKQIRQNVSKYGGDVKRLNLRRGGLNAGSNTVKVIKK